MKVKGQPHAPVALVSKKANKTDWIKERMGFRVDLWGLEKRKTPFLQLEIGPVLYQ
jgi:hypothetical protein